MKLQIVEYKTPNMLEGNIHYRYMLGLDGRVICWTGPSSTKRELKEVYSILMDKLLDGIPDLNPEHYMKFDVKMIPGCETEVIFEGEVSNTYWKELYTERKMKAIEEDFK